jgi:tetratricopeptide (TPR) repeat protein
MVGISRDYTNIGNVYDVMGDYSKALEYHNKALEINTGLNNRVGLAGDNYNISFPFYNMNKKKEALEYLSIAKTLLLDLEKETDIVILY